MMLQILSASLLMLTTVGPQIVPLDDERFRVTIRFDDLSVSGHTNAQLAIISAAVKACKGKGRALSEGTLEVNGIEPLSKGRKALELNEVYRCVPKK